MGLIITNSVAISIGEAKSNMYCAVIFHTQELLITGKVQCDLSFYTSEAEQDSGADKIYPTVNGGKVTNCTIQLTLDDVIKQSGVCKMSNVVTFFYTKVKEYLESTYNWTIIL